MRGACLRRRKGARLVEARTRIARIPAASVSAVERAGAMYTVRLRCRRGGRGQYLDARPDDWFERLLLRATRRRGRRTRARLRAERAPLGDLHRFALVRCCLPALILLLGWGVGAAQARFPAPPHWWLAGPGACVRQWESGNGRTSPNLYGMLAGWAAAGGVAGRAGQASRAEQDYRAYRLYLRLGWEPWRGQTASRCGLS
jgi:hypothetical protein